MILSTGGTIAMTKQTAQRGAAMNLGAANLVGAVPRLADPAEIEGRDVLAKPSADFTLADIAASGRRHGGPLLNFAAAPDVEHCK